MLNNIINKVINLSLKEPGVYSYLTIDAPMQKLIRNYFLGGAIALVLGIIFSIFTLDISPFLMGAIISVLCFYRSIKYGRDCINGTVHKITGIYLNDNTEGKLIKRNYIAIMLADKSIVKFLCNDNKNIEDENEISVYYYDSSLRKENEDTYILSSSLAVSITKTHSNLNNGLNDASKDA